MGSFTATALSPLPFPEVSAEWYKRQYALATKNVSRERYRQTNTPTFDEEDSIIYVNRSQVEGTLQENIQTLTQHAKETKDGSSEKRHTEALISVGKYILDHGPLVKTQDVSEVYKSKKGLVAIRNSVELYEAFCKHLNVSQVYLFGRVYVIHNTPGLAQILMQ